MNNIMMIVIYGKTFVTNLSLKLRDRWYAITTYDHERSNDKHTRALNLLLMSEKYFGIFDLIKINHEVSFLFR